MNAMFSRPILIGATAVAGTVGMYACYTFNAQSSPAQLLLFQDSAPFALPTEIYQKHQGTSLEKPIQYTVSKRRQPNQADDQALPPLVIVLIQESACSPGKAADTAVFSYLEKEIDKKTEVVIIFTNPALILPELKG